MIQIVNVPKTVSSLEYIAAEGVFKVIIFHDSLKYATINGPDLAEVIIDTISPNLYAYKGTNNCIINEHENISTIDSIKQGDLLRELYAPIYLYEMLMPRYRCDMIMYPHPFPLKHNIDPTVVKYFANFVNVPDYPMFKNHRACVQPIDYDELINCRVCICAPRPEYTLPKCEVLCINADVMSSYDCDIDIKKCQNLKRLYVVGDDNILYEVPIIYPRTEIYIPERKCTKNAIGHMPPGSLIDSQCLVVMMTPPEKSLDGYDAHDFADSYPEIYKYISSVFGDRYEYISFDT